MLSATKAAVGCVLSGGKSICVLGNGVVGRESGLKGFVGLCCHWSGYYWAFGFLWVGFWFVNALDCDGSSL